ncbi:MAG: class I SAM-dependent methyltransferase [Sphingomonas sp.]|uniref:class I SAM-dependent methyltransferase n=1 Tax=Sphingomonas sp. TaxID=28214 RepID=UPI0017B4ED60|nr:hypothetical protein [Zymomonas sp.]MBA4772466.1 class I SAM-dependent methyltransferase [Sphingomonas sp.]
MNAPHHPLPTPTPPPFAARLVRALSGRTPGQILAATVKTLAQKLRRLTPAARAAARRDAAFDRQWGTDTSREVTMSALDFPAELRSSSHHYQASGAHILDRTIACAGIDPATFTFVDLGCGKGRVVLLAAARGFPRVIGVEYSPALVATAELNARQFLARGGATVTPVFWQGNAADYPVPAGDVFVYLYNSFGADILAECLAQIERAKADDPARRIVMVYVNPQHGGLIADRPGWREGAAGDDMRCFECEGAA